MLRLGGAAHVPSLGLLLLTSPHRSACRLHFRCRFHNGRAVTMRRHRLHRPRCRGRPSHSWNGSRLIPDPTVSSWTRSCLLRMWLGLAPAPVLVPDLKPGLDSLPFCPKSQTMSKSRTPRPLPRPLDRSCPLVGSGPLRHPSEVSWTNPLPKHRTSCSKIKTILRPHKMDSRPLRRHYSPELVTRFSQRHSHFPSKQLLPPRDLVLFSR